MKKKAEIIIAALTLMFLCFSIGYFVGRRSLPSSVSVNSGTVLTSAVDETPSLNAASAMEAVPSPEATSAPSPTPLLPSPTPSAVTDEESPSPEASPPDAQASPPDADFTPDAPVETPDKSHYDEQGRLRINLATQAELEELPGIGPALASRIIDFRDTNGGFNKLTTLKSISGIGDKRYDAIKDLITVE